MKNLLIALMIAGLIAILAAITTKQRSAPDIIYLESGQKLVTVQYHDLQLIVTTRDMNPDDIGGIIDGQPIIKQS